MWAKVRGIWEAPVKMKYVVLISVLTLGASQLITRTYPPAQPPQDFTTVIESNLQLKKRLDDVYEILSRQPFEQRQEQNIHFPTEQGSVNELRNRAYAEIMQEYKSNGLLHIAGEGGEGSGDHRTAGGQRGSASDH